MKKNTYVDEDDVDEDMPSKIGRKRKLKSCEPDEPVGNNLKAVQRWEFGEYAMNERYNADSVPFSLDGQSKRAFVPQDEEVVQISELANAEKRFGTFHVFCHGGRGPQPENIFMLCRGKGTVWEQEHLSCHPPWRWRSRRTRG